MQLYGKKQMFVSGNCAYPSVRTIILQFSLHVNQFAR